MNFMHIDGAPLENLVSLIVFKRIYSVYRVCNTFVIRSSMLKEYPGCGVVERSDWLNPA